MISRNPNQRYTCKRCMEGGSEMTYLHLFGVNLVVPLQMRAMSFLALNSLFVDDMRM